MQKEWKRNGKGMEKECKIQSLQMPFLNIKHPPLWLTVELSLSCHVGAAAYSGSNVPLRCLHSRSLKTPATGDRGGTCNWSPISCDSDDSGFHMFQPTVTWVELELK